MNVENKIRVDITIDGVTFKAHSLTEAPDSIKGNRRFRELAGNGTLVELKEAPAEEVFTEPVSDEEDSKVNEILGVEESPKRKRWSRK